MDLPSVAFAKMIAIMWLKCEHLLSSLQLLLFFVLYACTYNECSHNAHLCIFWSSGVAILFTILHCQSAFLNSGSKSPFKILVLGSTLGVGPGYLHVLAEFSCELE